MPIESYYALFLCAVTWLTYAALPMIFKQYAILFTDLMFAE